MTLVFFTNLFLSQSSFAQKMGTSDTGGGNTIQTPITINDFNDGLKRSQQLLPFVLNYFNQKYFINLIRQQKNPDWMTNLFATDKDNVFIELERTPIHSELKLPCYDRNNKPSDGSFTSKNGGQICLSYPMIKSHVSLENLTKQLLALLAHEISHKMGIKDADEGGEANILQKTILNMLPDNINQSLLILKATVQQKKYQFNAITGLINFDEIKSSIDHDSLIRAKSKICAGFKLLEDFKFDWKSIINKGPIAFDHFKTFEDWYFDSNLEELKIKVFADFCGKEKDFRDQFCYDYSKQCGTTDTIIKEDLSRRINGIIEFSSLDENSIKLIMESNAKEQTYDKDTKAYYEKLLLPVIDKATGTMTHFAPWETNLDNINKLNNFYQYFKIYIDGKIGSWEYILNNFNLNDNLDNDLNPPIEIKFKPIFIPVLKK
jgi:hypothetical protein